jgi:exopolysaccharide biosynthesis polyprenyl glycosylphosphotransferase
MNDSTRKSKIKLYYIVLDIGITALCWSVFYIYRKWFIEPSLYGYAVPLHLGAKYLGGVVGYTLLILFINYSSGYYNAIFRRTKLEEFTLTFINTFIGVTVVFFVVILDDVIVSYKNYYHSYFFLLSLQLFSTLLLRALVTRFIKHVIHKGEISFNTLIIGKTMVIRRILDEFKTIYPKHGHRFVGYIPLDTPDAQVIDEIPRIGDINDIHRIAHNDNIDDVMVLLEEKDNILYKIIVNELNSADVNLLVNTELYSSIKRKVEITQLFQSPLIKVSRTLLTPWQASVKKATDIVLAVMGIIVSFPIGFVLALAIKLSSRGPVFYYHERIGQYGKPFRILKFRSMYYNAESEGPQLSSKDDPRITPVGRFMRRLRLDEIPNLVNVLKGDMSFVGPRPERRFYIDQIIKVAPEYNKLLQLKPGVTSLGQVKFGYAGNVDEMIRRMKYDLFYVENISLSIDFEILVRTIMTILKGKGI